jgi:hypothetical protein
MSKYTTEVRFICESYAGLQESGGYNDIENILDRSYDKIFAVNLLPRFNGETDEHRTELFKKILRHYYTREIAYETVGLWKQKINTKLMEILPYYNQLYESELVKYNPLENVSMTRLHEGAYHDNQKDDKNRDKVANEIETGHAVTDSQQNTILRHSQTEQKGNDVKTNHVTKQADTWTLYSDTPQGGVVGLANAGPANNLTDNAYLTNATHGIANPDEQQVTSQYGNKTVTYNLDGDKNDTITTHTVSDTNLEKNARANEKELNDIDKNGTDAYHNTEIGKYGAESYQEMIIKWREAFLNIDMMIIDELEPLFFQLW